MELDASDNVLNEDDEEFQEAMRELIALDEQIKELKISTIYCPLVGEPEELNIGYGARPSYVPFLLSTGKTEMGYLGTEKTIEKHLENELASFREDMKRRVALIGSLHLTAELPPRSREIYRQIVKSFIFGIFDGSCVLCRALIEQLAKRYIVFNDMEVLLEGKKRSEKSPGIIEILSQKLQVDNSVIKLYGEIASKADNILHKDHIRASEEETLKIIQKTQKLVSKFPKMA